MGIVWCLVASLRLAAVRRKLASCGKTKIPLGELCALLKYNYISFNFLVLPTLKYDRV